MASKSAITLEHPYAADLVPPLTPELYRPKLHELAFLKEAICQDEEELRQRIEDVQKE